MNRELNLKKIINVIKAKIIIILIVAVVFAVVAFAYTKITVVPRYASVIKFCLKSDISMSSTSGANERNQYMYANELMATCLEILRTTDAYVQVNEHLHDYAPQYMNKIVTSSNISIVQNDELSNVIHVRIVTTDPQLSYDACYAFESMAIERVTKAGKLTLERIDSPQKAVAPISSGALRNAVLAFCMGFALASLVFVLKVALDNTVKDGAVVCEDMGILLLAEIPDIYQATEADEIYEARIHPMK